MATASQIVSFALQQKGKPYVFGASGPNAFDCSGFIHYVLKNCGIQNTRTSVAGYWTSKIFAQVSSPKPGDLVFFQNTYTTGPSHLGIMINADEFIHASDETTGVIVSKTNNVYWSKHFLGYGRLNGVSSSDGAFVDVPTWHWAYDAIMYLVGKGIVSGYGNGYFGTGDGITRGQIAEMVYRATKPADSNYNPYRDIDGHMFKKAIMALTNNGVFSVNDESLFYPDRVATRAEVVTIIARAFKLKKKADYEFEDAKGHWANEYIKIVYSNGVASGTGGVYFSPDDITTREQMAMFLYRALNLDPNYVPKPIG